MQTGPAEDERPSRPKHVQGLSPSADSLHPHSRPNQVTPEEFDRIVTAEHISARHRYRCNSRQGCGICHSPFSGVIDSRDSNKAALAPRRDAEMTGNMGTLCYFQKALSMALGQVGVVTTCATSGYGQEKRNNSTEVSE